MSARPLLLAVSLITFGCAEAPLAKVSAPPQGTAAPVTEVDLSPSAAPPPVHAVNLDPIPKTPFQEAMEEAKAFGMMGLLNAGDPKAPSSKGDPLRGGGQDAMGGLMGTDVGDSFGVGGLGMTGTGWGAGGTGAGTIGLGSIGTMGHGAGTGTGSGYGMGSGRLGGANRTNPPKVRVGASSVSGRLPPEIIQRIVRQSFGRFRYCYEKGLQKSATLAGKVTVRFVIGTDGATTSATNAGSDLPSKEVIDCVVKSFSTLSYPKPEGGVVVVVYPISFEPGDPPAPPPAASATTPPATPPPPPAAPKPPPAPKASPPAPINLDDGP